MPPFSFILLFCGAWSFLVFHLSLEWWKNPQYSYGFIVPFLSAALIIGRRHEWMSEVSNPPSQDHLPAKSRFLFFLAAFSLFPVELLRQVSPQLRSIGVYGAFICVVLTFWVLRRIGFSRIPSAFWGSVLLFLTAVPWPTTLEVAITQKLMKEIAGLAADVLGLMGIRAEAQGNLIQTPLGLVGIDEACSGIRSLQSCIMVSVALSFFFRLTTGKTWLLVAAGVLLALVGNLIRTLTLAWLAASRGPAILELFHDSAGWSILIGVTFVLFWIAKRNETPFLEEKSEYRVLDFSRLPQVKSVVLIAVSSLIAAHLWFWAHDTFAPARTDPSMVLQASPGFSIEKVAVPPAILATLEPREGVYYRGRSLKVGDVSIYSFFWPPGSNNLVAFFHRPDICMTGVGWKMTEEVRKVNVEIAGKKTSWHIFSFERNGQHVLQAWGVWRDGVEQKLNFSQGWQARLNSYFQYWDYIWQGRHRTNTQIVSVIVDARMATEEDMQKLLSQLFTLRKEPSS